MPYIIAKQRALEFHGEENILAHAAEAFRAIDDTNTKAQDMRDFIAYVIDGVYGEECFAHSQTMANQVAPAMIASGNLLAANIAGIHGTDGGREGLLNYAITRFFNEAYPSPRYKDFNAIAGILSSLLSMCHPGNIELLGMLSCCKDEYYRKYAAPYEEIKERENGSVTRPDAPAPTAY
jgi:hypothetical protein